MVVSCGSAFTAGASTVSEMMHMQAGFTAMSFPSQRHWWHQLYKIVASPLPQITICPTGGISATTAPDCGTAECEMCRRIMGGATAPDSCRRFCCIEALARDAASLAD